MRTKLMTMLHAWLIQNSPDLLLELQQDYGVSDYLSNKISSISELLNQLLETGHPDYIIEEQCMEALTADLLPSKYLYIRDLVEEEFPIEFQQWTRSGLLTYELYNLVQTCDTTFLLFEYSEASEDSRELYYNITGIISNYLEQAIEFETVL